MEDLQLLERLDSMAQRVDRLEMTLKTFISWHMQEHGEACVRLLEMLEE